jgi:hypothetical protein
MNFTVNSVFIFIRTFPKKVTRVFKKTISDLISKDILYIYIFLILFLGKLAICRMPSDIIVKD